MMDIVKVGVVFLIVSDGNIHITESVTPSNISFREKKRSRVEQNINIDVVYQTGDLLVSSG